MHKNELRGIRERDLLRALEELEETWSETLLHGSDEALEEHTQRTRELEEEYLRRHPDHGMVPDLPITGRLSPDRAEGHRAEGDPRRPHAEEEQPGSDAELAGGEAGVVGGETENGPDDTIRASDMNGAKSADSADGAYGAMGARRATQGADRA